MPNQSLDFVPGTLEGKTLVISDIVRVFKRYFWLIAVLAPGAGFGTFLWAKHQPKLYDAVATIQVDQHEMMTLPGAAGGGESYDLMTNTQMLVIESRDVALKVIQRLHLEQDRRFNYTYPANTNLNDPYTRNVLIGMFHSGLVVQQIPRTELINIIYRSNSQMLSMEVANATVDTYLEQNFQNRYMASKEITGWLTSELNELKEKIQIEQSDLLGLEVKLGIYQTGPMSSSIASGPASLYQSEMNTLEAQLLEAERGRLSAEAQYHILTEDHSNAFLPLGLPGANIIASLETQLTAIAAQEEEMTVKLGPNNPQLLMLKKQEAEYRKQIAYERTRALQSAKQQVDLADDTLSRIKTQINSERDNAKNLNSDTVKYEVLRSQYSTDQGLYNGLLQILSAGGIDAGLRAQNVNRMSAADIPTASSWPRISSYTTSGFFVGFAIGVVIITIIIIVSDTVETVEQIEEALRLPVLTSVPLYKMEPADPSASQAVLATLLMPRSAAAESYRILRTAINLMPISGRGRVIGVTSCGPGEGKSTTVMNLAVAASQQNKRVLLIDGDLRKPALAQRLKLPSATSPGLSRYLSDPQIRPEDCIQQIPSLPGLSVLPVQDIPPFPSELLAQGRLGELLNWARDHYDTILIDTPPVLLVADSIIIAEWLDIVLIVARVRVAQRRALRRVREEFARFPDKQMGIVVNAVPHSQSYYGGYSGYHGYYGSDAKY